MTKDELIAALRAIPGNPEVWFQAAPLDGTVPTGTIVVGVVGDAALDEFGEIMLTEEA